MRLTGIKIEGLRGIASGDIDGLAPITILLGPNGCGKSTVLEALGVLAAKGDPERIFEALSGREWLGLDGLEYWFNRTGSTRVSGREPSDPAEVAAPTVHSDIAIRAAEKGPSKIATLVTKWQLRETLSAADVYGEATIDTDGLIVPVHLQPPAGLVEATSPWPFALHSAFVDRAAAASHRLASGRFSSRLREAWGALRVSTIFPSLLQYLSELRPEIDRIESLPLGDRDEPFILEKEALASGRLGYPLAYAGDGFRRSLLIAAAFARGKGGIVALDEPDAHSHPRLQDALAKLVVRARQDGTQVVIATHSMEFVQRVLTAAQDAELVAGDCAVIGLALEKGVLDPVVISGDDARRRVVELGDDLRL